MKNDPYQWKLFTIYMALVLMTRSFTTNKKKHLAFKLANKISFLNSSSTVAEVITSSEYLTQETVYHNYDQTWRVVS